MAAALAVAVVGFASSAAAQSAGGENEGSKETSTGVDETQENLAEKALRKRLEYLLSGYHFSPSREELDEVAEASRITGTLEAIASDDEVRPSLRTRAVDTLALYEEHSGSVDFLEGLLEKPAGELSEQRRRTQNLLRHHAITAIAQLQSDQKAVETLGGLLASENLQIRLTVVSALGQHAGEAGERRLEKFVQSVEDDVVREEVGKYVDVEAADSAE